MIQHNLAVGQTWRLRRGDVGTVVDRASIGNNYLWTVTDGREEWKVKDSGRVSLGVLCDQDLMTLEGAIVKPITAAEAVAGDVKLSNPKEAMGDKKVPLWLCSTIAMAHWAAAQVAGYLKYGAWNWRAAGVRASTYLSAMARHLGRYTNGERLDPVDGTHHLGNIMACCAILLEAEALDMLTDDRPPRADPALAKAMEEVEAICARLKVQYADRDPKHWTIADTIQGE